MAFCEKNELAAIMRRKILQFAVERNGGDHLLHQDIDQARDEMLFKGGSLNRKLLGANARVGCVA